MEALWVMFVRPVLRRAFVTVLVPLVALAVSIVTTWVTMGLLRRLRDLLLAILYWLCFGAIVVLMTTFFMYRATEHPEYVDWVVQSSDALWQHAYTRWLLLTNQSSLQQQQCYHE